jgi:tripartite-type tricarboxylate transporter receptor subunit TctC
MFKLAVAALAVLASSAIAQHYPSRPIRMIVASTPGSGVDIVARLVAQRMSEPLKAPIVVDNRAGGGGTIGVQIAARAVPDGYTILMAAPSLPINALLVRPAPYDVMRDFTAVGQATTSQYIIVLHPSVPARNVKELIALAKAKPGQLNYGSGGNGNSTHLNVEYFKSLAGVDFTHVAYKGSGPAVTDLLGGQIHLMFANMVAVLPQVKSGKLRALATTGPARSIATPDIPTVIEAGVPGYVVTSWFGLLAPSRTPSQHVARLNTTLVAAMREREMQERIAAEGAEPASGSAAAFQKLLSDELVTWGKVIKTTGL